MQKLFDWKKTTVQDVSQKSAKRPKTDSRNKQRMGKKFTTKMFNISTLYVCQNDILLRGYYVRIRPIFYYEM